MLWVPLTPPLPPTVFSQGDKGTSWYIVWKGSVNVVTHGKVGASPRSHPILAATSVPTGTHFSNLAWVRSGFGFGLALSPCRAWWPHCMKGTTLGSWHW